MYIKTQIKAPSTNTFTFTVNQDNGADLWFAGVKKISRFGPGGVFGDSFSVSLVQNRYYDVWIKFWNGGGPYELTMYWSASGLSNQLQFNSKNLNIQKILWSIYILEIIIHNIEFIKRLRNKIRCLGYFN